MIILLNAVDFKNKNLKNMINGKVQVRDQELACTLSHFKAWKYFIENSDSDYAIIIEDDFSFDTVKYWNFTWKEYIKNINIEYDMIQLVIFNMEKDFNPKFHKRTSKDESTAAYLIKKDYAKKMLNKYLIDGKFNLPKQCVADHFIYNEGNVYAEALFVVHEEMGMVSDINPQDKNLQWIERDKVLNYWKKFDIL